MSRTALHEDELRAQAAPATLLTALPVYVLFALAVFAIQGMQPLLGPDHVTYFQLADEILAMRPDGDFWRESNSVRAFGVILAYLWGLTGSHILSMKLVLAVFTVLYLVAADLFFSLFATARWQAVLFALLSGFAVSFGLSSWGVTDSTALLPRTLVAPIVMLAFWLWLRYPDTWQRYLAFPLLVCGSLLHLSTFYVIGILGMLEAWDFIANRRLRLDWRIPAILASLVLSAALLFAFEWMNLSVRVFHSVLPGLFAPTRFQVAPLPAGPRPPTIASGNERPANAAAATANAAAAVVAATAKEAWALELSLRPWRNMPLPLTNVANMFSSVALVLAAAIAGLAWTRRAGFNDSDRFMAALFVAVPVFAFAPQTLLWILRSFRDVYPATIEEVRAIGFVMIPALYFTLRLLQHLVARGGNVPLKVVGIAACILALPLMLKSLPTIAREGIFSTMIAIGAVNPANEGSVNNARVALGIMHQTPFYYSSLGVLEWLRQNSARGARILTDRDEMVILRGREIIGPRQVAGVPQRAGVELPELKEIYFRTKEAMQARDTARVRGLALSYGADYFVVPWDVPGAAYRDRYFSVVAVRDR